MTTPSFIVSALLTLSLCAVSLRAADDAKPSTPPGADGATEALKSSPRHGEWVDVDVPGDAAKLRTFVAYPERKDDAPVVIVIHEIFGLTDWVRAVADQLAAEGFIAVAPDLLSGKGPSGGGTESFEGDKVREAVRALDKTEVMDRLDAVRDYALKLPAAGEKSATIGFCWGGGTSFNYAAHQPELNAAVVYYGPAPTDAAALAKINCPVLGLYGEDDARITSTVDATAKAMTGAGKTFTHHVYPGAGHGFLRQQDGKDGANAKAAREAWAETVEFLKANLEEN